MKSPPIAITGMHRSGTSMITRGLHAAGLALGGEEALIDAADDNPEGFWENKHIVECNDELLELAGGSWDNPPELLPVAVDDPRLGSVAGAATDALAALRQHDHWGFKDPRTCLTARYWLDLEPDLRFVVCVRHPLEVALSLKRRNQNSYSLGLTLWEQYYTAVLEAVPAERRIITHYDTYFIDPDGEFARLCDFAGLEPGDAPVRTDLRHHTIGASLPDAGVSSTTIALYRELCDEAGLAQPPDPPVDEGRVHRLILDGAVAQRHADQRQDAVERLEAREHEFRTQIDQLHRDKAALETELRNRLRRVEAQLAATKTAAINTDDLRAELTVVLAALADTRATMASMDAAVQSTAGRVEVVVNNTRPGPGRRVLRRGMRLLYRGGRRYGYRPVRIAAQQGKPRAKSAARRLPEPAQVTLRRGRRVLHRGRRRLSGSGGGPADQHQAPIDQAAPDNWLPNYQAMVASTIPDGAATLVVDGARVGITDDAGRSFPPDPATDDLGSIAALEVGRHEGFGWLVVPEQARTWLAERPALREHLAGHTRMVTDRDGAGVIFDLEQRPADGARTLRAEIIELTAGRHREASILDWTDLAIIDQLDDLTAFTAPAGDTLPYFDDSVDIVIVDRNRDRREAARVAALAVVTVEVDEQTGQPEVHTIESQSEAGATTPGPSIVILADDHDDERWRQRIGEVAVEAGAEVRFGEISAATLDPTLDDFDVTVLLEGGVVPLPGSISRAATAACAGGGQVVTGKTIAADGTLESAGGIVFADRSVGLIGHGSAELTAPWHEYTRPVCWASGLVAAPAASWSAVARPTHLTGRAFVREWCADAWSNGVGVHYQPRVTAVRVTGDGGEPAGPLHTSAWQRVLDLRPTRPTDLSDGAWRYVLAHDDVEACRP
ncbi:MAG: sulfotransferase [Acidimicrobiales bacterium]